MSYYCLLSVNIFLDLYNLYPILVNFTLSSGRLLYISSNYLSFLNFPAARFSIVESFILRNTIRSRVKADRDSCIFDIFIILIASDALSVPGAAMVEIEQIEIRRRGFCWLHSYL